MTRQNKECGESQYLFLSPCFLFGIQENNKETGRNFFLKGGGGGKNGERWPNCRETNTVWNLPTLHHETKAAAAREKPAARGCKAMTIDPPMAKTSPSLVHRLLPLSVCVSLRGRVRGRVRLPQVMILSKTTRLDYTAYKHWVRSEHWAVGCCQRTTQAWAIR